MAHLAHKRTFGLPVLGHVRQGIVVSRPLGSWRRPLKTFHKSRQLLQKPLDQRGCETADFEIANGAGRQRLRLLFQLRLQQAMREHAGTEYVAPPQPLQKLPGGNPLQLAAKNGLEVNSPVGLEQ